MFTENATGQVQCSKKKKKKERKIEGEIREGGGGGGMSGKKYIELVRQGMWQQQRNVVNKQERQTIEGQDKWGRRGEDRKKKQEGEQ